MDVYIKPAKKVTLAECAEVRVRDVAEVVATAEVAQKVRRLKLLSIAQGGPPKQNYAVSVTDIIKVIKKAYPDCAVNNVGAQDTVVQYAAARRADHPLWKWVKVCFVVLVLMVGSSTAIMSFHTDAQIPKVFENYYQIFFNKQTHNPRVISIPYSIGLAVGIVVFYNHFLGKKLTDDPTPIEVEMTAYETEVTETMLETLNAQKEAEHGSG